MARKEERREDRKEAKAKQSATTVGNPGTSLGSVRSPKAEAKGKATEKVPNGTPHSR